ncbi:hypothetical protein EG68_10847 [Paragonimus skrjabini miyazakii]|uniref:Translocator protein n=1 Tax=Paragonimus skrjabini miyazakii TaxID=59628 RepID=A0A8S9YIT8_9TREM|nr:hypothetical protein EG68_10847 [Paragonimus skrjabini miyazakii]
MACSGSDLSCHRRVNWERQCTYIVKFRSMDYRAIPFIVTPFIGSLNAAPIVQRNMGWYDSLKRPSFAPPKWVFGPLWSAMYATMGTASYLVWRDADLGQARLPLAVYGAHLLLNWSWTPVFFGAHKINASVAIVLSTLGGAIACAVLFRPVNELASNMMLPYVAWLMFASAVNIRTAMLN